MIDGAVLAEGMAARREGDDAVRDRKREVEAKALVALWGRVRAPRSCRVVNSTPTDDLAS